MKKFLIKATSDHFHPESNYEAIEVIKAINAEQAEKQFLEEQEAALGRNPNEISIDECREI